MGPGCGRVGPPATDHDPLGKGGREVSSRASEIAPSVSRHADPGCRGTLRHRDVRISMIYIDMLDQGGKGCVARWSRYRKGDMWSYAGAIDHSSLEEASACKASATVRLDLWQSG